MNPNVSAGISENPVKEELLSLIQEIRSIEGFSGDLQDIPDELKEMVRSLEGQGVDFNGVSTLKGGALLQQLKKDFRDTFNGGKDLLKEVSSVIQSTLDLSPEAQEVQKKFTKWLDKNKDYAIEHNIQENVKIGNNGIELLGGILEWSGHTFGGVDVKNDADLNKQPYTIEQMGAMMETLGGKALQLKDGYKLGGSEISSFLSEVANIELGNFYWSSSRREHSGHCAWGVSVIQVGVFVCWNHRSYDRSSLSSENGNSTL